MEKSDILKVNKLVFEYILNLDDVELKQLLNGVKVLELIDGEDAGEKLSPNKSSNKKVIGKKLESSKRKPKASGIENDRDDKRLEEVLIKLNSVITKEEAYDYLKNSGLKVNELKAIAKKAEIFVKSRSKKEEIIDKLVQGTVGVKIKMKILKEG